LVLRPGDWLSGNEHYSDTFSVISYSSKDLNFQIWFSSCLRIFCPSFGQHYTAGFQRVTEGWFF
jgi:hypothetical protein